MLTRRENFLRTLRRLPHDRMPAYLVIDGFNYADRLPAGVDIERLCTFTDPAGIVELSRYFGLDTLMRITPSPVRLDLAPGRARTWAETPGEGETATYWETTRGRLRRIARASSEANTTFTVEHPIKSLQDYEVLLEIIAAQVMALDEAALAETRRYLEAIGDEGIAYVVGPATPIMDLTRSWAGLERFIYDLADAPPLIEGVLEAMADDYCRQYELIAASSPCQVMVLWDDANSLYISPRLFERYAVPVLRRYAEIAHRHGKILVNHTCGKIGAFVALYPSTGADALDWVTPPPAGDVDPRRAQEAWGDRITMQLAVVPAVMRNGTPDQVAAHLHALLRPLDVRRNLVLMIPPPVGTPLANLRRAVEVLCEDYGVSLNCSPKYGSVLD